MTGVLVIGVAVGARYVGGAPRRAHMSTWRVRRVQVRVRASQEGKIPYEGSDISVGGGKWGVLRDQETPVAGLEGFQPVLTPGSPEWQTARPPADAGEAIAKGLEAFEAKDVGRAEALFTLALELPGAGMKRDRNKPAELSREELQAVHYNLACCALRLGEGEDAQAKAMNNLRQAVASGYSNDKAYAQLKEDRDLAAVQNLAEFTALLASIQPSTKKGLFGLF